MPPPTDMVLLHIFRLHDELDEDQDLDLDAIKTRGGFDPTIHLERLLEREDIEVRPNEGGTDCFVITAQGRTRLRESGLLDDERENATSG